MVPPIRNHQAAAAMSEPRRSAADSAKQRSLKRESSFVRQKSNLTAGRDKTAAAPAAASRQPTTPVHRLQDTSAAAKKSPVIPSGAGLAALSPLGSPRKVLPTAAKLTTTATGSLSRIHHSSVTAERSGAAGGGGGSSAVSPLVLSSGTFNRRLTATLSPEECKMMFTHTEKVKAPISKVRLLSN